MEIKKLVTSFKDVKEVKIQGWVRNRRFGKNFSFLMINDGTCFDTIQVVFSELSNLEEVQKINIGGAVEVIGTVVETPDARQDFEIVAKEIKIVGESTPKYPLQPKKHSYEMLRDIAHLRARSNTFNAVFRIRSVLSFAIHEFFNKEGFLMVHSPIITSSDCEGAGEMFQVTTLDLENVNKNDEGKVDYSKDFFGKKGSLTVSGQLLAESYALAFSKVYTFGPTFRAENSNTTRHISEFWMLEPEVAFAQLEDIITLSKDMLIYVVDKVLKECPKELAFLNGLDEENDIVERLNKLVDANFYEIDYREAIILLEEAIKDGVKFENEVYYGVDLATEHERYLTDVKFKAPVFVKNYPAKIKAFYMKQNNDDTVAATDLLVPGIGELIGGSQREVDINILKAKMKEHDLSLEEYNWYLELREFGGVDHAGFGLGFERLVMYVTGMTNIRDVIPFPRTPNSLNY